MTNPKPDPMLPCGYCCAPIPCGAEPEDHDDMTCKDCLAVPLSSPHPECLKMVDDYMAELDKEGRY